MQANIELLPPELEAAIRQKLTANPFIILRHYSATAGEGLRPVPAALRTRVGQQHRSDAGGRHRRPGG